MELRRAFIEGSLFLNVEDVERGVDSMYGEELSVDEVLAEILSGLCEVVDFDTGHGDVYLYEEDVEEWLRKQPRGFTSKHLIEGLVSISHRLNWNNVEDRRDRLPRLEHGWDLPRSVLEHL